MICIAFIFCLCSGKYNRTTTDDQTFALDDIVLYLGRQCLWLQYTLDTKMEAINDVSLTFTRQENMEEDVVIAHIHSEYQFWCPFTSIIWMVLMHQATFWWFNRPYNVSVKLASYYTDTGKNMPLWAT